jgi:hypothetical protein
LTTRLDDGCALCCYGGARTSGRSRNVAPRPGVSPVATSSDDTLPPYFCYGTRTSVQGPGPGGRSAQAQAQASYVAGSPVPLPLPPGPPVRRLLVSYDR